jgi:hypothetical protein
LATSPRLHQFRAQIAERVLIRLEWLFVAAGAVEHLAQLFGRPERPFRLFDHVAISAGSVRFLIDNARMGLDGWACDASCLPTTRSLI